MTVKFSETENYYQRLFEDNGMDNFIVYLKLPTSKKRIKLFEVKAYTENGAKDKAIDKLSNAIIIEQGEEVCTKQK